MLDLASEHSIDSGSQSGAAGCDPLTVEQAIANLTHPDLSLRYYAAWWLGKFRVTEPAAVEALIVALEDESDRTELGGYPLRRNAARALGKLEDRRAVPPLIQCLECSDYYVREAAAQSLGLLGDPAAIPALRQLLAGGLAAAQPIPGLPHLTQPYEAVLEALGVLLAPASQGMTWLSEAERAETLALVQPFLDHFQQRVQFAATRAMYQLTQNPAYGDRLIQALADCDIKLRRTLVADLGATGYLPAATAIAEAAVESSFKLFALKNLLAAHLRQPEVTPLAPTATQVMALMDRLL